MQDKPPAYFRARIAVIQDLLVAIPENRDRGTLSNLRTLLKNGIIDQKAIDHVGGGSEEKLIHQKLWFPIFQNRTIASWRVCYVNVLGNMEFAKG